MRAQPILRRRVTGTLSGSREAAQVLSDSPVARSRDHARDGGDTAIIIPGIDANGDYYPIEKLAAHKAGALHLAVSVFVFSEDHLLIQKRAAGKYHCAGLWANTCCTHPHWDESPQESAARRLHEEMGLSLSLSPTAVIEYAADVSDDMREYERVHVFRAMADRHALVVTPSPDEVSDAQWKPIAFLREDARATPEAYAPWFLIYLERWDELGF